MPLKTRRTRWQLSLLAGLSLAFAAGCSDDPDPDPTPDAGPGPTTPTYEATIKRTAHGIPHITAKDMGSLGYGEGYAFAKDHVCILADQILKVQGRRAEFLGQGANQLYAASDFAYRLLDLPAKAQASFSKQTPELQSLLKGYVAGFNRYVKETPAANLPKPCTNAAWVKPITPEELLAYHISVGLAASSYQLILAIAAATPPTTTGGGVGVPPPGSFKVERPDVSQVGSNGWALGKDKSEGGRGMVVANPHFPWEGELKLWESHLTVPGQLNIYGVGLLGVPAVLIGFNENVAWTHTFSYGQRMTLYRLPLVEGKPTTYKYDGGEREMTAKQITILVKLPEGSLTNVTRTMYTSHYGPILTIPGTLNWTAQYAYTLRDANLENTVLDEQFLRMDKAKNLAEFKQAFADVEGIPWVNTMAADKDGNVWYTDATPTPNLKPEAIQTWLANIGGADPVVAAVFNTTNLVLLDGSNSQNEWQTDPEAKRPGIVPFSKVPKLDRTDFVFNANDSYWLSNPLQPLKGYSPMHGFEDVGQSPRTRMNAELLMEVREDGASGANGKFNRAELENAILSNRSMTEELLRDAVVQRCEGTTNVTFNGKQVDISTACSVLKNWDGLYNTNSVGAHVWREFAATAPSGTHTNGGTLYAVPFDKNNPITTPNTLAPPPANAADPVLQRLAQAVDVLNRAGIALNVPLGQVQYSPRVAGEKIPIHGGMLVDGTANVVSFGTFRSSAEEAAPSASQGVLYNSRTGLSTTGYVINNGSSFIMAMEFTDQGPKGRAVLTYSESSDPASPYFADQTRLFSNKEWRDIVFTDADIATTKVEEITISGD